MRLTPRTVAVAMPVTLLAALAVMIAPAASADNKRLNDSIVANVHTMMMKAGCADDLDIEPMVRVNPKLRLAAEWHANDVLNNHALDGDIGSDGSTVADRARNAGYDGEVEETTAINPALAINGIEILNQWFYRPDYHATRSNCANVDIGVWSVNSLDRSVLVAVYGRGDAAGPVQVPGRQFG